MRKREGELERERERSRESKTGRKNKYERRERRVRFRLISAKGDIFFVRAGEHEQEEEEEKKKKKQEQNQEQNQKRADGLCLTKAALLPSCSSNYSLSPPPPQSLSKLTPASLVNPDISDSTETLDLMAEAREEVNGTVSEIYAKEDAKDKTNEVYEGKEIIESTVGEREDMAEEKKKYFKRQKDEAPESVEMSIVKPFSSLSHCTFHSPPAHSISKLRTRSFNHYDDHKFHSGTAAVKTSANICDKDSDGDGDDIHLNSYNDVYKDDDDDGIAPKMIVFGDSDSASFTLNTLTPPNLGPSSPSHPPSLSASHSPSASAVAESGEEASEGSSAVQSSTSSDSFAKSPALDKDGNSGGNIKNDDNNDNNSRARVGFGCSAVQSTSTQGAGGERGLESENQDNTKSYGCSKKLPLLTPLVSPSSPLPKSSPLSHPMGGSGSNANVRRSLRLILNDDSLPPTTLPPSSSSPVSSSSPLLVSSLSMPYPLSPLLSAFQSKIKRAASFFLGSSDTKQPKKTQDVAEKEDDGVDEPVDVDVTGEEDYRLEVQEQNGNDHQTEASTEAHRGAMVEAIDQLAEMEVDAEAEAEAAAAEEVKAMSEERDETEEAVLRACKQFSRLASTFASGAGCFHMPALHLRDGEEIEDRHHIEHTRMDEEKDRDCIVAAAADIEAETAPGSECECEDWQEERGFEACLHMFSEDIFRVERLIKHRGKGQRKQYLVKWLGYNDSENTWELRENLLCGGEDLIAEYEYNLQLKQKHIKRRKRKRSYTL